MTSGPRAKNKEAALEKAAEKLRKLRLRDPIVRVTEAEKDALIEQMGRTPGNIVELMSLPTEQEDA